MMSDAYYTAYFGSPLPAMSAFMAWIFIFVVLFAAWLAFRKTMRISIARSELQEAYKYHLTVEELKERNLTPEQVMKPFLDSKKRITLKDIDNKYKTTGKKDKKA